MMIMFTGLRIILCFALLRPAISSTCYPHDYSCTTCVRLSRNVHKMSWLSASSLCRRYFYGNLSQNIYSIERPILINQWWCGFKPGNNMPIWTGFLYMSSEKKWVTDNGKELTLGDKLNATVMPTGGTLPQVMCGYLHDTSLIAVPCDSVDLDVKYILCEHRNVRCGPQINGIQNMKCEGRFKSEVKYHCRLNKDTNLIDTRKKQCPMPTNLAPIRCNRDEEAGPKCYVKYSLVSHWKYIVVVVVAIAVLIVAGLSLAALYRIVLYTRLVKQVRLILNSSTGYDRYQAASELLRPYICNR